MRRLPFVPCRRRDCLALAAFLIALVVVLDPLAALPRAHERTLWVGPDGSDVVGFGTRALPLRTVQRALDVARAGDEIRILPGIYRERLLIHHGGTVEQPLRIRADEPGSVTISGWRAPALTFTPIGNGIYAATAPWPVYRLRIDGRHAFHHDWADLDALREWSSRDGAWDAFVWDAASESLFLWVRGGTDPTGVEVLVNDPVPPPREWGNVRSANVRVDDGHVELEGLRLEGGVGSAVHLWNAESLVVRDCVLEGADFGIATRPSLRPAERVLIERTAYHNYPQGAWRADGWLRWEEVYASHASSTLVASSDAGVHVRASLVAHYGDGVRLSPAGGAGETGAIVERSLFFRGTDDALEFDGAGHSVSASDNLVFDAHESVSLSPITAGPVVLRHNLFLHPQDGLNGAQLKFLPPEGRADRRIRNIRIVDNLFVGRWLAWHQAPVENTALRRNTFVVEAMQTPPLPPGAFASDNEFLDRGSAASDPVTDPASWRPLWWSGLRAGPAWLGDEDLPFLDELATGVEEGWMLGDVP